jgi:MarR family transcriptional regulator, transcriptional regulator for hemolysin
MGELERSPLGANLGWLLAQASHALKTELTAGLEELGISPRAHHVLKTALGGEYTQTELARMVGLDKTTMVVTLDELEAAGLAERRLSVTDRRARVVAVTAAGAAKVRQAEAIAARIQADVLDTLPAGERRALMAGLARLTEGR